MHNEVIKFFGILFITSCQLNESGRSGYGLKPLVPQIFSPIDITINEKTKTNKFCSMNFLLNNLEVV